MRVDSEESDIEGKQSLAQMPEAPFKLDGFEPAERLGGGGFGDVWLAHQVNIDRKVAIKVGHSPISDDTVQLRFERECVALGRLSGHRHIIDVFTAGRLDDGRPFLVLEYVGGGTMWQRAQNRRIDESEVLRIGKELSDALVVAHEHGVLHRDLKPENVLLRENGETVLGDFGIARLHDGAYTASQAIAASVAYAAPEILSGKPPTFAADIYGIGICMLAAMTRKVPFVQRSDQSIQPVIRRVLTDRPDDVRELGYSNEIATVVELLLNKNPDKRPKTAEAVRDVLADMIVQGRSRPQAAPTAQPPLPPGAPQPAAVLTGVVSPSATAGVLDRPSPVTPATDSRRQSASTATSATGNQEPIKQISRPRFQTAQISDQLSEAGQAVTLVAAFVATLVIGGLGLFIALQLIGDGQSNAANPELAAQEALSPDGPPLAIPLTAEVIADNALLSGELVEQPDDAGADADDAPLFCGNRPAELEHEYKAVTIEAKEHDLGLFQQRIQFANDINAGTYWRSVRGTVDCEVFEEQTIDGDVLLIRPTITDLPGSFGDQHLVISYRVENQTRNSAADARGVWVRSDNEVYLLSVFAPETSDADLDAQLMKLLGAALDELGWKQ